MNNYREVYKPDPKTELPNPLIHVVKVVLTIALWAFVGILLAWRG